MILEATIIVLQVVAVSVIGYLLGRAIATLAIYLVYKEDV